MFNAFWHEKLEKEKTEETTQKEKAKSDRAKYKKRQDRLSNQSKMRMMEWAHRNLEPTFTKSLIDGSITLNHPDHMGFRPIKEDNRVTVIKQYSKSPDPIDEANSSKQELSIISSSSSSNDSYSKLVIVEQKPLPNIEKSKIKGYDEFDADKFVGISSVRIQHKDDRPFINVSKHFNKDCAAWHQMTRNQSEPYIRGNLNAVELGRPREKSKELNGDFKLYRRADVWDSLMSKPSSIRSYKSNENMAKNTSPSGSSLSSKIYKKSLESLIMKQYFSPVRIFQNAPAKLS